jgi:hypothetical protein
LRLPDKPERPKTPSKTSVVAVCRVRRGLQQGGAGVSGPYFEHQNCLFALSGKRKQLFIS